MLALRLNHLHCQFAPCDKNELPNERDMCLISMHCNKLRSHRQNRKQSDEIDGILDFGSSFAKDDASIRA